MQEPGIFPKGATIRRKRGFWRQQFRRKATKKQVIYDWIFGVAIPLLCVVADPVVFGGAGFGKGPLLGQFKPFAYLLSFFCISAMIGWLLFGRSLKGWAAPLAGLFFSGGIISLILGIVLFPLSLVGLAWVIGVLGFTPIFSAVTYFRNAKRALFYARLSSRWYAFRIAVLSGVAALVIPYLTNLYINNLINEMVVGDEVTIRRNGRILLVFGPIVDFERLGGRYCRHDYVPEHVAMGEDPRHKVLAEIYKEGTGESIERIDFHICEDY